MRIRSSALSNRDGAIEDRPWRAKQTRKREREREEKMGG
jgi:hypothetical protein